MKKVFYLVTVATLGLMSCQQEQDPVNEVVKNEPVTFKASIENFVTRADIQASDEAGKSDLVWTSGDEIGIFDGSNHSKFILQGNGGKTGVFAWNEGTYNNNATVAFFPFQGYGSDKNNVYNGTMYFKLLNSYYTHDTNNSYTSGKMLTPLIASISSNSNTINFKHAGAAVKVNITNLPKGAHSISMKADGQQIWGNYQINPANAGTVGLSLDGDAHTENNEVLLNFAPLSTAQDFTFIFPVPGLTTPKFSFSIYDKNNILVWSRSSKALTSNIGRGDILVMPALTITPYSQYEQSEYQYRGSNYKNWQDVSMYEFGNYCILGGLTFNMDDEFKIHINDTWYPDSNWKVQDAKDTGNKAVIFKKDTGDIWLVDATDCAYPSVPSE